MAACCTGEILALGKFLVAGSMPLFKGYPNNLGGNRGAVLWKAGLDNSHIYL